MLVVNGGKCEQHLGLSLTLLKFHSFQMITVEVYQTYNLLDNYLYIEALKPFIQKTVLSLKIK